MGEHINITGKRFGRLVAIKPIGKDASGCTVWQCRCDCGNTSAANISDLRRKRRSCGCIAPKPVDITNQRFGKLIAICPTAKRDPDGNILWRCRCDCGKFHTTPARDLRRGLVRSCGCMQRCTHGYARHGKIHPTYHTWIGMRDRCRNPKNPKYKYYGGRGIKVCKRWETFEKFLADVGTRPPNKTLDRYPDKNGAYKPGNVRWATILEQRKNQRPPRKRLEQFSIAELKAELRRRK